MTKHEIWKIAMQQSAIDANCAPNDFQKDKNVVVYSKPHPQARRYLELPFICNLISYGNNVVASTLPQYAEIVQEYLNRYSVVDCFQAQNLHGLFEAHGMCVCLMSEYWLAERERVPSLTCRYPTQLLSQQDFIQLYLPEWSNALCEKRKELDVLGIGAYDGDKLIGLAACSADCDNMWQIGVDVLPEYRQQGIASALTSQLTKEIFRHGKVPFYCCTWSNVKSARNAIKSGFSPAWIELVVKPSHFADAANRDRESLE